MNFEIVLLLSFLGGVASTLPLGPAGLSIVTTFSFEGVKRGVFSIGALLIAELIYLAVALTLREYGVLELSSSVEVVLSLVFGLFLLVFGLKTYQSSKERGSRFPLKFKSVFFMSLLNPTLIITYLGLFVLVEKTLQVSLSELLVLCFTFLSGVWATLFTLGMIAKFNHNFVAKNMGVIKKYLGPLFMILGLTTVATSF